MLWRPLPWLRSARLGRTPNPLHRNLPDLERSPWTQKKQLSSKTLPISTHEQLLHLATATPASSSDVTVAGIVRSARWKKNIVFAHIHDGTTYAPLQAILPTNLAAGVITNGAFVKLSGRWQSSPAKGQSHELHVSSIDHAGLSDAQEYPIQKASMTPQHLRTIPHMRIRTPFQGLLARARSELIASVSEHFSSRARPVVQVQPPLITSSDCEGAGEVFTVSAPKKTKDVEHFFKEPKYLTVSSQLHLEAWSADLGDVWALSPTFRAEESDTGRHLAEFYMLEAEYRSLSMEEIMAEVQSLIRWVTIRLSESSVGADLLKIYADHNHRPQDSEVVDLADRWNKLGPFESQWPRITYTDAMSELVRAHDGDSSLFAHAPSWNTGLALEHERWIVDNVAAGIPTFVTHYPSHIKPFYMLPSSQSDLDSIEYSEGSSEKMSSTVACFDLLLPHGYAEAAGGSLREHRLKPLIENMRRKGLLKKAASPLESDYPGLEPGERLGNLQWYADLRRFGSSPHGGYGIGFDRLLAYLTGASNLRDVVGFPRYWGNCRC